MSSPAVGVRVVSCPACHLAVAGTTFGTAARRWCRFTLGPVEGAFYLARPGGPSFRMLCPGSGAPILPFGPLVQIDWGTSGLGGA